MISEPLEGLASTTSTPNDKPLMILLRRGKLLACGGQSSGSSETSAPPCSMICAASRTCRRGYRHCKPVPSTAIVLPPPSSAP